MENDLTREGLLRDHTSGGHGINGRIEDVEERPLTIDLIADDLKERPTVAKTPGRLPGFIKSQKLLSAAGLPSKGTARAEAAPEAE